MQTWEYATCNLLRGRVVSARIGSEHRTYVDDLQRYQKVSKEELRKLEAATMTLVDFANHLGAEGWELVGLGPVYAPLSSPGGQYHAELFPVVAMAVFKRPLGR